MSPDRLARLRHWVCERKVAQTRTVAMRHAKAKRARGEQATAYRCPFPPFGHWHTGRPPSMETLEALAEHLRERHAGIQPAESQAD